MYEVGRPKRLSVEEALEKEAIWQDFKRFADARLARRGRCHETEVLRALQRELPKYRQPDSGLDGGTLRCVARLLRTLPRAASHPSVSNRAGTASMRSTMRPAARQPSTRPAPAALLQ